MSVQSGNYDLLITKLDRFTRKYYLNKLIRGSLYFLATTLVLFLLFSVLEHQFFFGKGVRKLFLYSFCLVSLISLGFWVLFPLFSYFRLGKVISHDQAAKVIGSHFSDVKDKLLNVLQLKKQTNNTENADLIIASINQKSAALNPVPFRTAIDLTKNRKYLKYALPPLGVILFILFAAPSIITDSTHRIINNDKKFDRKAPFKFEMANTDLSVVQFEDYTLEVSTEGTAIPKDVFIRFDDFQYRMEETAPNNFSYTFRNVQKDVSFEVFSGFVNSNQQNLKVLLKPNLTGFHMDLVYPKYTKRQNERLENIGDVVVPQGTRINWSFDSANTDSLYLAFAKANKKNTKRQGQSIFNYGSRFMKSTGYTVHLSNKDIMRGDSINYYINVTPDQIPSISVKSFQDSTATSLYYFVGDATDDYGISSLHFKYKIENQDGSQSTDKSELLLGPSAAAVQYDYTFDLEELALKPGQTVKYYFEVFDNDGVNGKKSARTALQTFAKPTLEEYEEKEELNEEEIKKDLEESIENIKKIQEEYKKLREKLLQEEEMDWQDKKELEKLLEKQKELREKLEKAKERFDENMKNQDEISKQQEDVLEKQEKIEELFQEVMDPETMEMMQKIEELMQELDKDESLEMMEQMEQQDQTLEKEMERLLELFKQLEMEKEIKETIEKLEELAEKQEDLAKETEEEKKSQEELKKEQEKINEEFEEIKEKMEELEKKNEELDPPKDMGDKEENEEQMEDIQEDLDDSQENLDQKENDGASKSQKSAAGKMKKMAKGLQSSMESGEMEQMEEDMQALRQLLENLVDLSFDQEDLVKDLQVTQTTTPRYVDLVQEQFKLKNDFGLIQDSLHALSTRVSQIETIVTEKLLDINADMDSSIDLLEARKKNDGGKKQRTIMKNVNDLAVMLSDAMDQMQQDMSGMMPGSQMCKKPGNKPGNKPGKGPADKVTEGQKGLSDQLKKLQEKMKSGKGDKKGKGKGKGKGDGLSKEFAEAAAKQAALRKALQDLNKEKREQGKGSKELQEIIDQMDKNETDLVNKRLNNETLKRHQDILTKLLESDKADRQREFDNKRKAESAKEMKKELPPSIQEYLKKQKSEIDLYKTITPDLRPFYKSLVEKYYNTLKEEKN